MVNYEDEDKEITLTQNNNTTSSGVPFPKTPRPFIYDDSPLMTWKELWELSKRKKIHNSTSCKFE